MTITQIHLDFWESKQPRPSWAARIKRGTCHVSLIDSCINSNAGVRTTETDTANLMALCRRHVGKGTLLEFLDKLSAAPGTVINPKKRSALARKWARRIGASL